MQLTTSGTFGSPPRADDGEGALAGAVGEGVGLTHEDGPQGQAATALVVLDQHAGLGPRAEDGVALRPAEVEIRVQGAGAELERHTPGTQQNAGSSEEGHGDGAEAGR